MRRRRKVLVAAPAAATLRDEQRLAGRDHFAENLAGVAVADLCAGRHGEIHILRRLPAHVLALAVRATLCDPLGVVSVVEKGPEVRVRFYIDAPALPSIAAVRPALGHKLLATEGGRPGAACAGAHLHYHSIYEHRCLPDPGRKPGEKRTQPRVLGSPGLRPGSEHHVASRDLSRTSAHISQSFKARSFVRSASTMAITSSTSSRFDPVLSAPRKCAWSCLGAFCIAIAASVHSSRRFESSPGLPSIFPYASTTTSGSIAGCSARRFSISL